MTETADTNISRADIGQTSVQQWPERMLGNVTGQRQSHFQVVFHQSVLDQIHLHGQGSPEIEVCGVLVGNVYQDAKGPYLLIDHCIRGSGAASKSTNVTFTAETWQHIHEAMDRDHPDRKILGWYHTHPGFGIFLSEMDVFICENFFNLPWQVAFVYDPQSGEEGNFVWREGKTVREPVLIHDDVTPVAAKIPLISKAEAMASEPPWTPVKFRDRNAEQIAKLRDRVKRLERRQQVMLIALVFLTTFVVFWALGLAPSAQNPLQGPATRPAIPTLNQPIRGVTP